MPPPTVIPVLAAARHPRLRYVLKEISGDLGYHFQLFTDEVKWSESESRFRITYGVDVGSGSVPTLPAHNFMEGRPPTEEALTVRRMNDIPTFFHCSPKRNSRLGFDPLACIFYCLSRYEEYDSSVADKHGRFPGRNSHAAHNGYLHLPVVRIWATMVIKELEVSYPDLPPRRIHPFYFQPTYDIDLLWAYRYRGLKGLASGARDALTGKPGRALIRIKTGQKDDPYNILGYLIGLHLPELSSGDDRSSGPSPRGRTKPFVFWLLANNDNRHDINPYPIPLEQAEQMKATDDYATHGLHPSYRTMTEPDLIQTEIQRFAELTGKAPTHARQHFLRFRLPQSYRALLLAGIRNDHSMGYADASGWRAGTNLSFYWYDLEKEERTGLLIHPFAAMEVTLKNYEDLSSERASAQILQLARATLAVGGPFTLLWHNSSFAPEHGWAGWGEVYEQLVSSLYNLEDSRGPE